MKHFRTLLMVLLALCVFGAAELLAQRAQIVVEAMSPHKLGEKGWVSNTTTGLRSVPKGAVVYLSGKDMAGGVIVTRQWQMLVRPPGSTAVLDSLDKEWTSFRPDTTGQYTIKLTITTSAGSDDTTVVISAGKFVGVGGMGNVPPNISQGQCAACHQGQIPSAGDKVTPWKTSKHATMFKRGIDGQVAAYYSASCIRCHTTGYDAQTLATNGGFDDVARQLNWTFPTPLRAGNFDTLAARYPQLAQLGTIGCETCHGPGSQHYGTSNIDKSIAIGSCAQCHDEPWRHNVVSMYENSRHSELLWSSSFRQQPSSADFMTNSLNNCIRCHDGQAFINYTNNVGTDTRAISSVQPLTCSACHEPHGTNNPAQLRKISVDTLANAFAIPANVGNGGVCMNCHKARRNGETYPGTTNISSHFGPHHSGQTDMLVGKNAHTFGQTIQSSIAHTLVENTCVGCHMAATPDTGNVARDHIGGHSWAMKYEVGSTEYDNVRGCITCHGPITHFSDIQAGFDYDGDGIVEAFVNELDGLRARLAMALPPFGVDSVSWQMIQASPDSMRLKKAYYNYMFYTGDHSGGIHNPKYAIGILQKSVTILTGVEFEDYGTVPTEYALGQNYPNPFNPTTTLSFSIPKNERVTLIVYDLLGKEVKTLVDEELTAGNYKTTWNGTDAYGKTVASGVYLYRLQGTSFSQVKKMVFLK